ncbi:MAG: hypothetical protein IJM34_13130 [Lachnospiraceae bacterium]|nr:hypothetical protein [Lachnospiraceae bacterium]
MKKRKCNLWAMLMVVMLCFSELGSLAVKASDDEQNDESSVMQTSSEEGSEAPVPVGAAPAPETDQEAEGSTLNIYVKDKEFPDLIKNHYPEYVETDSTHGKIGDVEVVWKMIDSGSYYDVVMSQILQGKPADVDKILDLYVLDNEYLPLFVGNGVALPITELGITESELQDQYGYTKDIARDPKGVINALTWQAHAGGLVYNRAAAKAILGSDDPAKVQEAVSSWDKFNETALLSKQKGYSMCSAYDTFRVYYDHMSGRWVADEKVYVDEKIEKWAKDSKALIDAGAEKTDYVWSSSEWGNGEWMDDLKDDGKTFCYFLPQWAYEMLLKRNNCTGWGLTEGPDGFNWGGQWIVASPLTDNKSTIKDILLKMTTDKDILKEIAKEDCDSVNSKSVMAELATDPECTSAVLGGQNPYGVIDNNAKDLDFYGKISQYDMGCKQIIQGFIGDYFEGKISYDQAIEKYIKEMKDRYGLSSPTPGDPTPTPGYKQPTPTTKPKDPTPTTKPGDPTPTTKPDGPTPVPDVEVKEVKQAELVVKGKIDAKAWIMDQCPEITAIDKIKVDNSKVAKADKKGVITAKKEGSVTVTASIKSGKKNYTDIAKFTLTVLKPVLSFKNKDLTYTGATLNARDYLDNVTETAQIHWSVPAKKAKILTIDENTGEITAGEGKGAVTISCSIQSYGYEAVYKAKINVKRPKAKETVKIKDGKSKKLTLSNVSKYTEVEWSSSSPAVTIESTKKPYTVKLTVNSALDEDLAAVPAVVTATVDGQEYKTTIQIK